MKFKLNVQKDTPDARDHIAMPSGNTLPSKVNLESDMGPVKNQAAEGSCTAHTGTEYREFLYRKFHKWEKDQSVQPANFRLSPQFFYGQERLMEGDFTQDGGAQSRTMMQVMSQVGCCLEVTFPYDRTNEYNMPTAAQMAEATKYKNTSYHRVPDIHTAKSVLASGYLVSLGYPVYESFQSEAVATTGKVPVPNIQTENLLGGHETLIFGYDDDFVIGKDKGVFIVRNSWGPDWGDKGNFYLPYKYLEVVGPENWDMWCAHLGKPWVPKAKPVVPPQPKPVPSKPKPKQILIKR